MLIGLIIGVLAIRCSIKAPATLALGFPLAMLAVPFLDTSMAIIRRKLTGRSIYATDRGHLHHCLLGRGYSNRRVLLLVALGASTTALAAVASLILNNDLLALTPVFLLACLLVTTGLFGHAELILVRKRFGAFLGSLASGPRRTAAREVQVRLQGSMDWEDLWARLASCATELELDYVCLDVNAPSLHEGYFARWERGGRRDRVSNQWCAEFPLSPDQWSIGSLKVGGRGRADSFLQALTRLSAIVDRFSKARVAHSFGPCDLRPHVSRGSPDDPGRLVGDELEMTGSPNGAIRADSPETGLGGLHLPALKGHQAVS